MVSRSYLAPTIIEKATPEALSLRASSIEQVIPSWRTSGLRMLVPPETRRTTGRLRLGAIVFRRAPRVSIRQSA